ncbi:YaiI/YqxD family protein [Bacillus cereus group sp. BfR-BA-01315]|uniref:YaiI/YqxD family protein n=1 Tax=Bacillus cereus group sp. BfR-BA-01315 TaxID=2920292 RepID=UPI001F573B0A|nr:YaiI/YqxD family protein [Bacillus cereus group sp. BfR-BA-01315]
MQNISKILVDADACPVKDEIVQGGTKFHVEILFVASYAHRSKKQQGNWIYVDSEQDEVDFYIYKHAKASDLVITQDMGLAGLLVKKGVYVLSPRGTFVTDEQMDTILYIRYVSAKLRRQGTYTKGPKAFSTHDRQCFLTNLEKILSNYKGIL